MPAHWSSYRPEGQAARLKTVTVLYASRWKSAHPTAVSVTPGTRWNASSTPQKQPPATVAVWMPFATDDEHQSSDHITTMSPRFVYCTKNSLYSCIRLATSGSLVHKATNGSAETWMWRTMQHVRTCSCSRGCRLQNTSCCLPKGLASCVSHVVVTGTTAWVKV
jgi:hypothetical protein